MSLYFKISYSLKVKRFPFKMFTELRIETNFQK